MTKQEFILYISNNNPGFFKTRKAHIKNVASNILDEIDNHIKTYNLTPVNFNDSVYYYVNNIINQNTCKMCKKFIGLSSQYCSNACKKQDIHTIISRTHRTLFKKNGSESPLGSREAKEKRKQTCQDKYGAEHPSSNIEIKNKIKITNIETYKDPDLRKNISIRIKKAYKNDTVGIIEKRKQSNFIKTGEYVTLTSTAINNAKESLIKKYNTSNPFAIHENTYELAKLGSLKFYNNNENKEKAIKKRIETIIKNYGSLDKMNEIVFNKKKEKTLKNLKEFGVIDDIIECKYNNLGFVKCKCHKCNQEYNISLRLLRDRTNRNDITCVICSPQLQWRSNAEIELFNWLGTYISCEKNDKKILKGGEIDIFIPEKRIAIEYNGIYWHSDLFKDKNYHLNKSLFLKNLDINLIHIWEDLWNNKKDIIKGRILSKLGINQVSIGARKCKIQEISSTIANEFYKLNHLQGTTKGFKYIGLFFNNEIISCISIGKRKLGKNKNINTFEILRFCNKIGINCIGAFSKLFNYIIKNYPAKYISYADLCWGEGNVYEHAGFKLKEYSKPNYWYFLENQRYHRYTFNKQKLIKMGYDKNKTEFQIMDEIRAFRVYDCGNAVWEYNI